MAKYLDVYIDGSRVNDAPEIAVDIGIDKRIGKNIWNEDNFLIGSVKKNTDGWYYCSAGGWNTSFGRARSGLWHARNLNMPPVTISFDVKVSGTNADPRRRFIVVVIYADGGEGRIDVFGQETPLIEQHMSLRTTPGKNVSYIYFTNDIGGDVYLRNFQIEYGGTETGYEPYRLYKSYDICLCRQAGGDSSCGDIIVYSLPFRAMTGGESTMTVSVSDGTDQWQIPTHLSRRTEVNSNIVIDVTNDCGDEPGTHVQHSISVVSDMILHAIVSGSTKVTNTMTIDVNVNGTTLWRYRILGEMDGATLSDYDGATLGDADVVIL